MKIILTEDIKVIDEIALLAEDIIIEFLNKNKKYQERCLLDINELSKYNNDYIEINKINTKGYDDLSDFLNETDIVIDFIPFNIEGSNTVMGSAKKIGTSSDNKTIFQIKIKLPNQDLIYYYNNLKQINALSLNSLQEIFIQSLKSTTIHELTHVYDVWKQKQYFGKYKQYRHKKIQNKISQKTHYENYLKIPHEYWARFSEAIKEVGSPILYMKDAKRYLTSFKGRMFGFKNLPLEDKKRLFKAALNYYYHVLEKEGLLKK